jgi:hypothetical protein
MNAIIALPAPVPSFSLVISATLWAPWRTDEASAAKSCTAPISTTPRATQISEGSQPNVMHAMIGPAIGPAAAIAEKCWPKR